MEKLNYLLDELKNYTGVLEKRNNLVSESTVGWQLAHSLKTIEQIVLAITKSEPKKYKWTFNFNRILILSIFKSIPRGKGKAPKIVMPDALISSESILTSFENVENLLKNWEQLPKQAYFPHPYFGDLNKKNTEDFLVIHTNHHLKIIKDICRD
jgi:hypothetical protein